MGLTKRQIERAKYEGKRYKAGGGSQDIRWDEKVPGLGLRIYPSGNKSFVLSYRNKHGQKHIMTLGAWGVLTLEDARNEAREALLAVQKGKDPLQERQTANAETIEELVETYIEKHAKDRRKTWKSDERRLTKHVSSRWPNRHPESITKKELSQLHREIGKDAQVEANRVIETIRTMYNFAADEDIVEDGYNPATKVRKYDEGSGRKRWLRSHEIEKMVEALKDIDNIYLRHYYWLLLLTATRRNELLEAKWEHVDLERRELFLPDTKNGSDHTVPLSQPAFQFLVDLPKQKGNPWVFCSHIKGQRIKEVNQRWRRVRKKADIEDVVLHDFRRTAASWLAQMGYSELVIKKLLNHTTSDPVSIYARMNPQAVREAVEDYGKQVMAAARGDETEVISIATARNRR